jgi:hypothetical protein
MKQLLLILLFPLFVVAQNQYSMSFDGDDDFINCGNIDFPPSGEDFSISF